MNIFEAIVKNNVDLVKELIERKISSKDELEPEFFKGRPIKPLAKEKGELVEIKRNKRRTALQLAVYLKRYEIVDALVN